MAGNDHRDGISPECISDRTRRTRFPDLTRDTGVRVDASERDSGRSLENGTLKGRHHAPIKGNIEARSLAAKILAQLIRGTVKNLAYSGSGIRNTLQPYRLGPAFAQSLDECLVGQTGCEIDLAQSFGGRRKNELADRTVHARVPNTITLR